MSITQVTDAEEGLDLLAALAEAINVTWEHRAELVPPASRRPTPRPLDVWALLPQMNCGRCGELTCMAFAFSLLHQHREVGECDTLALDERFADRRIALQASLG